MQDHHLFGNRTISLGTKLKVLLVVLTAVTIIGGCYTLWYIYETQKLFQRIEDRDIAALVAAQGLESELVAQKGYVTYFFLTGDDSWLTELGQHAASFEHWMTLARDIDAVKGSRELLNRIESGYLRFAASRDRVVELYRREERDQGQQLHWEVRKRFVEIYELCERYKRLHEQNLEKSGTEYRRKAQVMAGLSLFAVPLSLFVALWLGFLLFKRILEPIRRLAHGDSATMHGLTGEIGALSERVTGLLEDVDHAHVMLQQSREQVVQAEKMAMVGKLAAGVAHSVRNPLTSVKMRLFSLERSLNLDSVQQEDFEVISEEIRHLDTIIRNFLEFSRPPKLKVQTVSPSELVDNTLQLLRHRLESCGVEARVVRKKPLPDVNADPEQLKEVLVNLIMNACDAMVDGGRITISEEVGSFGGKGSMVAITVSDDGPGIPASQRDHIFKPFHSTKEEGTGLGLSIANRIMAEHGGWIHLQPSNRGASFLLALPLKEAREWLRS
ncbi:ATP-binding protein [Salidesulfovibrio brasiliensis]|uniref:ATP-binding protein n=1 Tax=Salidesulfovibrio brasiliensis TaxID=221711 RepID=UPI0006CFE738|nr:ATP-binding protein [Salidesulfovibrio brasiliensis]